MSTIEALPPSALDERSEFEYRPLYMGAIASVVMGLLSSLIFFAGRDSLESALLLAPLPLIGIALGLRALRRIRENSDRWTGQTPAKVGLALSAACLIGGIGFAGYVRATECPPGYEPTSFAELKPDEVDLRGDHLIPADIAALDGKKVFIKGYIRPDSTNNGLRQNIKRFLLVRDNNQCCFGDMSTVKFFDQVAVEMADKRTIDFSFGLQRIGGTLRITPINAINGTGAPVFALEADHAE
jgi:hypothetical protein